VEVDPAKIDALLRAPVPTNFSDLRGILGLTQLL